MSKNITWDDRTDATTATGATTEWSKDQSNPLKAWAVAPLQSLGAFDETLITLDGTGATTKLTMSANLIITFAESGHEKGNGHLIKIVADGTKTLKWIKPDAYILTDFTKLINGATLASGVYRFIADFDGTDINLTKQTGSNIAATSAPTITSFTIENATDDILDIVASEAIDITTAGWNIDTDGAALSILSVLSGSGTTTPKLQLSRSVLGTEILNMDYDSAIGNTIATASPNLELEDITDDSVTNNVSVPTIIVMQDDFAGVTIDTGKWSEASTADVTYSQNNVLQVDSANASTPWQDNELNSILTITTGGVQADLTNTDTAGAITYFGLYNSDNDRANVYTLAGGNAFLIIKLGGGTPYNFDSGISFDNTFKIEHDPVANTIKFFYWDTSGTPQWTQLGSTQSTDFGSLTFTAWSAQSAISGGTSETTWDNFFLTNNIYSTQYPV